MNKKALVKIALLASFVTSAQAGQMAAVNPATCVKLKNTSKPFMLVVEKDQDLKASIIKCVTAANIKSAALTGIGALQNTKLAYYNIAAKKYEYKFLPDMYELISLNGNVTQADGGPMVHLHVALSDSNYKMTGGHLESAEVGATTEITVIPFSSAITRKQDDKTGLQIIATE